MLESLGGSNLFSAATPFKNMEPFHFFQEVAQSLPAILIKLPNLIWETIHLLKKKNTKKIKFRILKFVELKYFLNSLLLNLP